MKRSSLRGMNGRSRVSLVNLLVMAGWRLEGTPGLCLWIVARVGVEPAVSMTNTRPSVELSYTWETSTNARPQGKEKDDMSTSRNDKGSYFSRLSFRCYDITRHVWWHHNLKMDSDRVETFDWRHFEEIGWLILGYTCIVRQVAKKKNTNYINKM